MMSTYVMSDIHGNYELYKKMLEKIEFSNTDELYILGDVIDRGPEPIKILQDMMRRGNIIPLAGNHEIMFLENLKFLMKEITEETIAEIDDETIEKLVNWQENGGDTTIAVFSKLSEEAKQELIDYIYDFDMYEELEVGEKSFILIHAGFRNFAADKPIEDYEAHELVWERPDYSKPYFLDKYVIAGHTPTMLIDDAKPGYIYHKNNHIDIDCGVNFKGGRLGCLRLDDMQEFYVEQSE